MDKERTELAKIPEKEEITKLETDVVNGSSKIEYSAKILTVNDEETSSGTETRSPAEDLSLDEREERLEQKWKKPTQPNFVLVQEMLERGLSPNQILQSLIGSELKVPNGMSESTALRLLIQFVGERRFRDRLPQYNDFTHAVELFRRSKNILIISGAGISVNCGIPDFRSTKGIYASLKQTFPDLPCPTAMFDIDYFKRRPQPFYSFAKEIFPGMYKPSVSHMFIKFLEQENKLLRNYTQNIDTLERVTGIQRYVECHGSFGSATCLQCERKFTSDDIREDIYAQKVARCPHCEDGLIKPDIVFFGENLPDHFHMQMAEDRDLVDLVVVIGSSLQVQPVSLIPYNIADEVPQILINKEDLSSYNADIKLIGDCDSITTALCMAVGGKFKELMLKELKSRSAPSLTELESLLATKSDQLFPEVVTGEELKDQLDAETQSEEDAIEKSEQLEDEVPAKKLKIDDEHTTKEGPSSPSQQNGLSTDKLEELRQMYEAKFISISSRLKGYSYAKFKPNLNIFPGADFYYDSDQQSFGALPRRRETEPDDPYSDNDQESSSSSSLDCCKSNPEMSRQEFDQEEVQQRAESCPLFDIDSSVPNSPSSSA